MLGVGSAWKQTVALVLASALSVACLPEDTRPVPGSAVVTATSDDALVSGFDTDDGWHVTYEKYLLSIGDTRLDDSSKVCDLYTDGTYRRILDMTRSGSQRVSLLYALGRCGFGFGISGPETDSVLGEGVTSEDRTAMLQAGTDPYASERTMSAWVVGAAESEKDGRRKTFALQFRVGARYEDCWIDYYGDARFGFVSGQGQVIDIPIPGRQLFLESPGDPGAPAVFDPMATADDTYGDGNGEVTLDELRLMPTPRPRPGTTGYLPDGGPAPSAQDGAPDAFQPPAGPRFLTDFPTMADYLYLWLFPQTPHSFNCATTLSSSPSVLGP